MASSGGFAVVDVETTGFSPTRDRVLEVAIIHVDETGRIGDQFCTLIDPRRDVGPTRVHGLRASSVTGAPTFQEAAPAIWRWLAGRVFVAHNVRFDLTFLDAELARCGLRLPPPPTLCTMRLSGHYLPQRPARTLGACCEAAGIALVDHHSALADALAAAQLLGHYRAAHRELPASWADELEEAARLEWASVAVPAGFRAVTRVEQAIRRSSDRAPLADLVHALPHGQAGEADSYLGVLDRVLEDRLVTSAELAELTEVAAAWGLTQEGAQAAHRRYLADVAAAAWRDATVTDAERADLLEVARLLGVRPDEVVDILEDARRQPTGARPGGTPLAVGDRIVFTGEMERDRDQLTKLAEGAGLRVTGAVSGKTALLVTSDPLSQSGKARRARELGVRVVTEQVFLYLAEALEARGRSSNAKGA